jgi:hypothetical protein
MRNHVKHAATEVNTPEASAQYSPTIQSPPRKTLPDLISEKVCISREVIVPRRLGNFSTTSLTTVDQFDGMQAKKAGTDAPNKGNDINRSGVACIAEELHQGVHDAGGYLGEANRADVDRLDQELSVFGRARCLRKGKHG